MTRWFFLESSSRLFWPPLIPEGDIWEGPAHLAALTHSSSEQRVFQAHIQTSTWDADVCRKRSRCQYLDVQGSERSNTLNSHYCVSYLNSCETCRAPLINLAGMFGENTQRAARGAIEIMEISFLLALHVFRLFILSITQVWRLEERTRKNLPSMLRDFCLTS